MSLHTFHRCATILVTMAFTAWGRQMVWAQSDFEPSWRPPAYEAVSQKVFAWIAAAQVDAEVASEARSLWPAVPLRKLEGGDLLQLVVETASILDKQAAKFYAECQQSGSRITPPDVSWVSQSPLPRFVQNNLRLFAARWATQQSFYDEALLSVEGLSPRDVVDPATLLFCRMVAHHQLVEPDSSRLALVQLLEQADNIPLRYRRIAELIKFDLGSWEDESLDHVSRQMRDVRRRLDLGEAGDKVQVVEKGLLDTLDKFIKKLEDQQKQSSSASGSSAQSSQPMQDSQLPSLQAPGKVDQRDIGHQAGWGDVPPKEREEALQGIGREFPAHYRQLIEQYFRDLAKEPTPAGER